MRTIHAGTANFAAEDGGAQRLLFALTFLATRVGGYAWGIYDIWRCYPLWKSARRGLYAVVAGCHAGLFLNLFWSRSVVAALTRAVMGGAKAAEKEA